MQRRSAAHAEVRRVHDEKQELASAGKFSLENLALCLSRLGPFLQKFSRISGCDGVGVALCQYQVLWLLWCRLRGAAKRTGGCGAV